MFNRALITLHFIYFIIDYCQKLLSFYETFYKTGKVLALSNSNKVLDNLLKILKIDSKEKFSILNKESNLIETEAGIGGKTFSRNDYLLFAKLMSLRYCCLSERHRSSLFSCQKI